MTEREALGCLLPTWRFLLSDEAAALTDHEIAEIIRAARSLYFTVLRETRATVSLKAVAASS